jgi:hypothetical protein
VNAQELKLQVRPQTDAIQFALMPRSDKQPRTSRSTVDPLEVWVLLGSLVVVVVAAVAPLAVPWLIRAIMIAVAVYLFRLIGECRRFGRRPKGTQSWNDKLSLVIVGGGLVAWLWFNVRVFLSGNWIEAALLSVIHGAITYLLWLTWPRTKKSKRGGR